MKFGLIGEKLPHSYSKVIFEELLGYPRYDLVELKREELADFFKTFDYDGLNVTVPYKTDVMPYLDEIDEIAKEIGAVNTIRKENGKLYGTNTDFYGLRGLLTQNGIDLSGKTVLILGTGGTSKTAVAVCRSLGAKEIYRVSRTEKEGAISYAKTKTIPAQWMLNTTPVGMFPNTDASPIDLTRYHSLEGVVDVIYNPLRTLLVRQAKSLGLVGVSGLYMLAAQAIASEQFFLKEEKSESALAARTEETYRALRTKTENLVLIGMPAVGKTTVGKLLAEKTGRQFYDTDTELEKQIGPIPDYIRRFGEASFREEESKTIQKLCKTVRGGVIATGGGVVLREENIRVLGENGVKFWLHRDADAVILSDSRPLSSNADQWQKLYLARQSYYQKAADICVHGYQTPEAAVAVILEDYQKW